MAVTTRGGMTVPATDAPVEVDPTVAAHEARHAAAALLLGLESVEARAYNPSEEMGGYVALGRYSELRPRESAVMTLAGRWGAAEVAVQERAGDRRAAVGCVLRKDSLEGSTRGAAR
jgi:hypothetical protein